MHRLLLPLIAALAINQVDAENARPDIIYILADDMGFSDTGCFGSEIQTPNLDSLAADGLRFTQFYNTGRCCPTRASLLTGLYPHQAGIGHMEKSFDLPGYTGNLNKNCLTIAEVLKPTGYRTYAVGKWHVTNHVTATNEADKFDWPLQRGFDRYYGTIVGANSYFDPAHLTRDNTWISAFNDPEYPSKDYYYTDAITDHATRFIHEHQTKTPDQPFFLYVAYTAAHWPMHAKEQDIAKYRGKYDTGYAATRDARYQRMLKLGLVGKDNTKPQEIPADSVESGADFDWDKHNMEVYAAMIDCMDQGIGRIIAALKETGRFDNTLICFLQDNGGCAETVGREGTGAPRSGKPSIPPLPDDFRQTGTTPKQTRDGYPVRQGHGVMAGPADTYIAYGKAWATVSNTPFRLYKHYVHEGGISTPLIAHWPKGIQRRGELDSTPGHLIDLMATAVDLSGATYPKTGSDGQKITPLEGRSLDPVFKGKCLDREAIYWEHEGNRAIRLGEWKLVALFNQPWELYNIPQDRSEQHDLSAREPARVKKMAAMWQAYADRANVVPWNSWNKPESAKSNRKQRDFKLAPDARLPRNKSPYLVNRPFRVTCAIKESGDGVVVAQGGSAHGWSLFIESGHPVFAIGNGGKRDTLRAEIPISAPVTLSAELAADHTLTLRAGDQIIATKTVPSFLTEHPVDGLDVGCDTNGSVGGYPVPNRFKGVLEGVHIQIEPAS